LPQFLLCRFVGEGRGLNVARQRGKTIKEVLPLPRGYDAVKVAAAAAAAAAAETEPPADLVPEVVA